MSKVNFEKRNIITLAFRQEKTDPDYGTCLWADFYFDLYSYMLSISSDCGDFGYGWVPTPEHESFVKLMCRIDKDYLLNKISDQSVFRLEESKSDTIANLDEYLFQTPDEMPKAIEEIEGVDCSTSEMFFNEVDEILYEYGISDSFELIDIVSNYPAGAIKIVEIFEKYIQPALQEDEK